MEQLQYDSLYKFLVSLGIILIILPIVALIFLFDNELVLISQNDYENLSLFSQYVISQRTALIKCFTILYPIFSITCFIVGGRLIYKGITKWSLIQEELDKQIRFDTLIKKNESVLSPSETLDKVAKEVKNRDELSDKPSTVNSASTSDRIIKYMKIEDLCYNYITSIYSKNYDLKRYIRLGKYEYDFIGIPKHGNQDLIFEVKYWVNAPRPQLINNLFLSLSEYDKNYFKLTKRAPKLNLMIVSPHEKLEHIRAQFQKYYEQTSSDYKYQVNIEFIDEDTLS